MTEVRDQHSERAYRVSGQIGWQFLVVEQEEAVLTKLVAIRVKRVKPRS